MHSGVLRLLTCGSVDDGKSTLIGRLLFETGSIAEDQMAALECNSTGVPDYALLLDGLQAEREQGITIDVAYRQFATPHRRFIVADTPGHIQYTRNMATGASTSDLALLLVDAKNGLLTQTLRHAHIASLFGIRDIVLAVNKMDLVRYEEDTFHEITAAFERITETLAFSNIHCVPVSALEGENLASPSERMEWYSGPPILAILESAEPRAADADKPFRMPVQSINRSGADFRGYSGTIVAGSLQPGQEIVVSPSERKCRVDRIATWDGDLQLARAGDAVAITLSDQIDVGRGDVLADFESPPDISDQLRTTLLWLDEDAMLPGRGYEIKLGTRTTGASISDLRYAINVDTMEHVAARTLKANDIGVCNISLDRPVAFDPYEKSRETGSFILIDRYNKRTIAAGTITFGLRRATNIVPQALDIDKSARARLKNQKPCVLWFTGLSGSGKSTIANRLESTLHNLGRHTQLLDGDNIRHGLNKDLGFTDADRVENIRRIAEVTKLFVEAGLIVLVSFISPFRSERDMARNLLDNNEFIEIFVDTPLELCEARDPKGLYKKARSGEILNFTGLGSPYEAPLDPEIRIRTAYTTPDEATDVLVEHLRIQGVI